MTTSRSNAEIPAERIDAHHHVWKLARGDYRWLTPAMGVLYRDHGAADLAPELARAGVTHTVLVQAADTTDETRFLLDVAREHAFVAGVVGWVDFDAAERAADSIAALAREPKLVGLRPMIQDIPDDRWMLRTELEPTWRALVDQRLTFDALVKPRHLAPLRELLDRHPDLDVVVDHAAKPSIPARGRWAGFDEWRAHLRGLARDTRAFVKLSGLVTEAEPGWTVDDLRPYVDAVLDAFGHERVMWGSDWPVLTRAATYSTWVRATEVLLSSLSSTQRDAVFGANARCFYRLTTTEAFRA